MVRENQPNRSKAKHVRPDWTYERDICKLCICVNKISPLITMFNCSFQPLGATLTSNTSPCEHMWAEAAIYFQQKPNESNVCKENTEHMAWMRRPTKALGKKNRPVILLYFAASRCKRRFSMWLSHSLQRDRGTLLKIINRVFLFVLRSWAIKP